MLPLSTSTTLSKHVVHEKLELARLLALTRGGRREGLGTGGARRSSWRQSGSTMRTGSQSAFAPASSNISCPLQIFGSSNRDLVGDLEKLVI
jgi:hypothetical protein